MTDIITFGETMLRLSPPGINRLEDAPQLDVNVGGAESNVAANLARMGKSVSWFSRLPDNPLGYTVRNTLRHHGVDTSHIIWTDDQRLGLYFVEYGQAPRGIQVWYDRKQSAAAHMTPDDLPLDAIADAKWLHLSGITPAISASCTETAEVAIRHAKANHTTISFDVNYRALLWDEETCAATVNPLCEMADVVFIAVRDAVGLFGAPESASDSAKSLQSRWGGTVIVSDGERGVYGFDGNETTHAPSIETVVVDRIGAGDALASGVICRLVEGGTLEEALQFGAALAALALTVEGDIARVSRSEVEVLLAGNSGSLRR